MANRMSSPLTVLRFSCWHFSDAVCTHDVISACREPDAEEVRTFAGDEGDELADALLHAFFGLFRDLGVFRQSRLHDPGDWSKVANVSVTVLVLFRLVVVVVVAVGVLGAVIAVERSLVGRRVRG